jgi:hypothetical protein
MNLLNELNISKVGTPNNSYKKENDEKSTSNNTITKSENLTSKSLVST